MIIQRIADIAKSLTELERRHAVAQEINTEIIHAKEGTIYSLRQKLAGMKEQCEQKEQAIINKGVQWQKEIDFARQQRNEFRKRLEELGDHPTAAQAKRIVNMQRELDHADRHVKALETEAEKFRTESKDFERQAQYLRNFLGIDGQAAQDLLRSRAMPGETPVETIRRIFSEHDQLLEINRGLGDDIEKYQKETNKLRTQVSNLEGQVRDACMLDDHSKELRIESRHRKALEERDARIAILEKKINAYELERVQLQSSAQTAAEEAARVAVAQKNETIDLLKKQLNDIDLALGNWKENGQSTRLDVVKKVVAFATKFRGALLSIEKLTESVL